MHKTLKELQVLTKMVLDAELMKLRQLANAEKLKEEQIAELGIAAEEREARLLERGGSDLALLSGADARWAAWRQRRAIAMNIERAAILAKHGIQLAAAKKAFGEHTAIETMHDNMKEVIITKRKRCALG